jgi:hypothetical protein
VDLDGFVRDGYVAVRGAVDAGTAAACQELIWAAMEQRGVRRDDPGNWPPLVEDLSDLAGEPFVAAYMAPPLTAAYDELIGPGRWKPSVDIGEVGTDSDAEFWRPSTLCMTAAHGDLAAPGRRARMIAQPAAEKLFTPLDSRTRTAWLVAGSMREKPSVRL